MRIIVFRNNVNRLYCVCLFLLGWIVCQSVFADAVHFLPTDAKEARWVFSGVVASEEGEQYGYFFQMARKDKLYHTQAAVFDVQTKALLLQDESEGELTTPIPNYWHVGHAFLQFNPINDSWVFGFKHPDKTGFNFKVDMLQPSGALPTTEALRPGINVLVSQAHSLNGHIYMPEGAQEIFVTAKNAWFRQIDVTENQQTAHAIKGVLCRFNDESGFYSINLPEPDALHGAMTARFNAEGNEMPMSQFIHTEILSEAQLRIHVPMPHQQITLSLLLKQASIVSGIAEVGERTGFCLVSEDAMGHFAGSVQTTS